MKDIKIFVVMARHVPRIFAANFIVILCLSLSETISVFSIGPMLDLYKDLPPEEMMEVTRKFIEFLKRFDIDATLLLAVSFFILTIILKNIFLGLSRYLTLQIKFKFTKKLLLTSLESYFNAEWIFFSSQPQGKILNTLGKELEQVSDSVGNLGTLLRDAIKFVFLSCSLFFISWKLACIILIVFTIIYIPSILIGKRSYFYGTESTITANRLQQKIKESLDYAKVIMSNAISSKVLGKLEKSFDQYTDVKIKGQLIQPFISLCYEPIIICTILIMMYIGNVYLGKSVTELIIFLYALRTIYPLFVTIIIIINRFKNILPSYEQIVGLEEMARKQTLVSGDKKILKLERNIDFKNIKYSYPGRKFKIENVNFSISKGEKVALVGKSGSGKSTIIDLILKHHKLIAGDISFDDVSINEIDTQSLRRIMGIVLQGNDLFNTTIYENLILANSNATDEDINRALKESSCTDFIGNLPDGINTVVGDKGANLSGGQRQRICIAMALVRSPELLILDEATSALDMESEHKINLSFQNISKDMTILMVAHRLSTIMSADKVVVFEEGEVVESGSFEELMKLEKHFYNLVNSNEILTKE